MTDLPLEMFKHVTERYEEQLKREIARADKAEEKVLALELEVARLNDMVQTKTIPALLMATQAIQASQVLNSALNRRYEDCVDAARWRPGDSDD